MLCVDRYVHGTAGRTSPHKLTLATTKRRIGRQQSDHQSQAAATVTPDGYGEERDLRSSYGVDTVSVYTVVSAVGCKGCRLEHPVTDTEDTFPSPLPRAKSERKGKERREKKGLQTFLSFPLPSRFPSVYIDPNDNNNAWVSTQYVRHEKVLPSDRSEHQGGVDAALLKTVWF
ncbi:hypothetical protein BO70DRAFT_360801 [Aspergillus heteromorphus CBS 117.55]|uniref:Uncharacterized protein n=1 Tax=Aspergillus heteromorphus CBS 117.55 TaxID=1448321 RepID=A0A317WNY9_9EURO|nr:uncharacterized protein BO70DRAFT_360801 [Aspergillus heteromorphus CBS 117.55]PWY85980.1 hypothetical protein BO70DRAFT_360801 [Aspergillus heteromorphus CBS 117.55]